MHAKFQIRKNTPDKLLIGLHAPIFGGDITGQVLLHFNSERSYELNLTASQINVAEFGKHNMGTRSQLSGTATARLSLKGLGSGMDSLEGNGSVDIPRGHFYNLPFLLDLLRSEQVDELFLTTSPFLAGDAGADSRLRLVEAADLVPFVEGRLLSIRRHGRHLFTRYAIERSAS